MDTENLGELLNIFNDNFAKSFIIGVITGVYAITASYFLKKYRRKKLEKKKEFFEILKEGLINETIQTPNDLVNIYKGVTNLSTEDISYRYGLNKWLREFLAKSIGNKIDGIDKKDLFKIKEKISLFIEHNEKISPFSDLPDTERNMLTDINSFSDNGDKVALKRKVKELGNIIQTRYDEQKKLESQTRWSIPLAIIGVILTVVFGIISIFQ
ncbi:hypothetical protein V6B16_09350 [Salinimicrobium catena]|uniref:hypothetical protein n=1 Tax=Salinimicrobium catena TaxID=390640 RepID=UPI002FE4435F